MTPRFGRHPVHLRVPASSANLGPGFDAFGLALGCYDELTVRIRPSGLRVAVSGEGTELVPRDETHLVVRSMRAAFEAAGSGQPPGLELSCVNRIPHGRGLGSSAAAIVAGVLAARALADVDHDTPGVPISRNETDLTLAAQIEGHPDNVAACLLGGFTISWLEQGETARAVRLSPAREIVPVALVPDVRMATEQARRLLPQAVPHRDAGWTAARAGLLVHALTQRPDLLVPATDDRLHQPYRLPAMPASSAAIDTLRRAGIAAVLSGAGPTVLALATRDQLGAIKELVTEGGWSIYEFGIDSDGVRGVRLRGSQD